MHKTKRASEFYFQPLPDKEFEIIVNNLWNIPKVQCIASQISCDFLIVEVIYRKTKVFNIFADQGND